MNVMKLDTGLYKRFHQEQKLLGEPDTYPTAYAPFSNLTMSLLLWKMTFTGLSSRINTLQTMTVLRYVGSPVSNFITLISVSLVNFN